METEVMRKLDAGLLNLVTGGGLDETGQVPVFIRAVSGQVDRVIQDVTNAGGRIRHDLRRFSAVAAWVPIRAATELASKQFVEKVEMSQPVEIA
ncbi:MAG: hypothetical protein ACRD2X_01190 [Vicinamibacteraceae bacterium]